MTSQPEENAQTLREALGTLSSTTLDHHDEPHFKVGSPPWKVERGGKLAAEKIAEVSEKERREALRIEMRKEVHSLRHTSSQLLGNVAMETLLYGCPDCKVYYAKVRKGKKIRTDEDAPRRRHKNRPVFEAVFSADAAMCCPGKTSSGETCGCVLIPEKTYASKRFAVCTCGWRRAPSPEGGSHQAVPVFGAPGEPAHICHVCRCKSPATCPADAYSLCLERQMIAEFINAKMVELGFRPILVTLTAAHHLFDLAQVVSDLIHAAHSRMRGTHERRKLQRLVYPGLSDKELDEKPSFEMFGKEWLINFINGHHLHCHDIYYVPAAMREDDPRIVALLAGIDEMWREGLKMYGGYGSKEHAVNFIQVKPDGKYDVSKYITKWGHMPQAAVWTAASEVTMHPAKRGEHGSSQDSLSGLHPLFDLLRLIQSGLDVTEMDYTYENDINGRRVRFENPVVWSHEELCEVYQEYAVATHKMRWFIVGKWASKACDYKGIKAKVADLVAAECGSQPLVAAFDAPEWDKVEHIYLNGWKPEDEHGVVDAARVVRPGQFIHQVLTLIEKQNYDIGAVNTRLAEYSIHLAQPGELSYAELSPERLKAYHRQRILSDLADTSAGESSNEQTQEARAAPDAGRDYQDSG